MKDKLLDEERQRRCLEGEIVKLKKFLIDGNAENGVTSIFFKDLFPTFYILCFFLPSSVVTASYSLKDPIGQKIQPVQLCLLKIHPSLTS